jgi:regulator of protease activity HflC (stomatin/prohibitin superfamily)
MLEMAIGTWNFVSGLPAPWNWVVGLGVIIGLLLFFSWRTVKFVKRDNVAIRERLGKPILKYSKNGVTRREIKNRKMIDRLMITLSENPVYGEPLIHNAGVVFINPFAHSLRDVPNQERTIQITNYPLVVDKDHWLGSTVNIMLTVKMVNGYRWQYRSLNVEGQIRAILADRLNSVCDQMGADTVLADLSAFKAKYLELVQAEVVPRVNLVQLGVNESELPISPVNFPVDRLVGSLARYGGYVSAMNIEEKRPMTEGWLPQAVAQIGANAHEMGLLLQSTRPLSLLGAIER